jgi:hypothetical protein
MTTKDTVGEESQERVPQSENKFDCVLIDVALWKVELVRRDYPGVVTYPQIFNFTSSCHTAYATTSDKCVIPAWTFRLNAKHRIEQEPAVEISATFRLIYEFQASVALAEIEWLKRFLTLKALPHVWPYWRQYLQITATQIGMPGLFVPAEVPPGDFESVQAS